MIQDTCRNISVSIARCHLKVGVYVSDDEVRAGLYDSLPQCIDRSL